MPVYGSYGARSTMGFPSNVVSGVGANFSPPVRTAEGFPPTVEMLSQGIANYRTAQGLEVRGVFPTNTMERSLVGREFTVAKNNFRIDAIRVHPIAGPVAPIGSNVEGMFEVMVPGIAAAVAAYPFLGTGEKKPADKAATQAMRGAMNRISMQGKIKGGEGGGRDKMSREGALYLGEFVGTGYGVKVDFLVDPLEVTNQANRLDLEKGDFRGGEGWQNDLLDPLKWYPGYSGALSLMAAVDASDPRGGFRELTDDLYLNKFFLPYSMAAKGLGLNATAEAIINAAADAFGVNPDQLRAAALGRSRHIHTFRNWTTAGMLDSNIFKPTDGDSMFAWAIASGLLQFGGLTGGVMEGVIGGLAGVPTGARMGFQFVAHAGLQEAKADADLLNDEHKFGFTDKEYDAMVITKLYDSQHMGAILRRLSTSSSLRNLILNAAHAEYDIPNFNCEEFLRDLAIIENPDAKVRVGQRFSEPSRQFLTKIFEQQGWLDVRRNLRLGDFRSSRDSIYFVTALTPNKWAPLLGIRTGNGVMTLESLFVGGNSQSVFITETDVKEIG